MKNKMIVVLGLIGLIVLSGCITGGGKKSEETASVTGAPNLMAVCVGWTSVDEFYYNGWTGECPGCDIDAKEMYELFKDQGFTAKMMLNGSAPWNKVRSTVINFGKGLKAGDLLVITFSGHGGQMKDDNGDEADGKDETICAWDGQVRDDEVLDMLQRLPLGVRVVMINDQCHSQGNFKTIWTKTKKIFGKVKKEPVKALVKVGGKNEAKGWTVWNGPLIQFAGCREASYSYGSTVGGTWTQALIYEQLISSNLTWRGWFDKAVTEMDVDEQAPQWVEYGNVQDSFRNGPAFK